jgi:hypothetical protein
MLFVKFVGTKVAKKYYLNPLFRKLQKYFRQMNGSIVNFSALSLSNFLALAREDKQKVIRLDQCCQPCYSLRSLARKKINGHRGDNRAKRN